MMVGTNIMRVAETVEGYMDDAGRLAAYDAFSSGVRAELVEVGERMDVLRAQNKVKTATYRQLFAQNKVNTATYRQQYSTRFTQKEIDSRLVERGL